MIKNIVINEVDYQLFYLTQVGSQTLFGNKKMEGLPVIVPKMNSSLGRFTYDDSYCLHNGNLVGGFISPSAFSDVEPAREVQDHAISEYELHVLALKEQFPGYEVKKVEL